MWAQATYAKLMWNAAGTGMLALTATDTDATNQSYYGEQKLSFLSADGTNDCLVQLKVISNYVKSSIRPLSSSSGGNAGTVLHKASSVGYMPAF